MKRYLLPLFLLLSAAAFSQTAPDVLKYSYLTPGGTARFLGAGSAFGALGAEFGTLSQNPAGLAMFRTSELMLTPSLRFSNTEATLAGNGNLPIDESKSHFHFDNIGIVFNTTPRKSNWKTFNVGIGYNQLANYNRGIYYIGNSEGSILNYWYSTTNSILRRAGSSTDDLNPFAEGLAWETEAIYDPNPNDGILDWTYDFIGNETAIVNHSQTLTQSGAMNEMVLSFAGNYNEKLMIGATVGVPFVRYRLSGDYREEDNAGVVKDFDRLVYTEDLATDGIGVNLKFGVIYRLSQAVRLGASFHTPTWLSLTDEYSNSLRYAFTNSNGSFDFTSDSPRGNFDYKLATPWRAAVSGAFIIKKAGFLSAEIEWVDYSANKYNFTADVASTDNQLAEREENIKIQRLYEPKMNIRLGGEAALDNFRLRAGVNLLGKPKATDDGFNMAYTAGVGVRGVKFYLDLGYRYRLARGDGDISPYPDVDDVEALEITTKNRTSDFLLTIGFKF